MPFYEYECASCKFYSEVMQKISDAPLKKCPSCGKNTFKKLISAPVFRLKGSGWYETDFKSDQERKRNLAGGDKDDSGAGSKTADKPAADAKPAATDTKVDAGKSEAAKPTAKSEPAAKGKSRRGKAAPAKRASPARSKAPKRRAGR